MQALLLRTALSTAFLTTAAFAGDIEWQASYDAAMAQAAADKKVVFVAVNMDGERANDRMASKVYKDRTITDLAKNTISIIASNDRHSKGTCSRFGKISCDEHRFIDAEVRGNILKPNPDGFVIAPQHVFLDSEGKAILSVPYEITVEELEWCFVTALKKADPNFSGQASSSARAPKRLVMGDVYDGGEAAKPITRDGVLELIEAVKRGLKGAKRNDAIRKIMTADEPEAIDFIKQELRRGTGGGGGARGGAKGGGGLGAPTGRENTNDRRPIILHQIGVNSPTSYWEVIAEYATNTDERVRSEAAVALEQLASPDSLKAIRAGLSKEKDESIEKNWLRALGAAGAADKRARKTLIKAATKEKSELLRINAIVALGSLASDGEIDEALTEILRDAPAKERAAAAIAMAFTRDDKWGEALDGVLKEGLDDEPALKKSVQAALSILKRGGELVPLRAPLRSVAGDTIERERMFGRGAKNDNGRGRGRNDGGDGEGDAEGDGEGANDAPPDGR